VGDIGRYANIAELSSSSTIPKVGHVPKMKFLCGFRGVFALLRGISGSKKDFTQRREGNRKAQREHETSGGSN
jgi:hypothetical protein